MIEIALGIERKGDLLVIATGPITAQNTLEKNTVLFNFLFPFF
jgi:hypothetical protein